MSGGMGGLDMGGFPFMSMITGGADIASNAASGSDEEYLGKDIGGMAGGALGTVFGPLGTMAGSAIGSTLGQLIESLFNGGKD